MERSCCICGMVLAHEDSNLPQWCKDIRAICWFEDQTILSGQGSMDSDIYPFRLPIASHGYERFDCQRNVEEDTNSCYPFHSACWAILLESDYKTLLSREVDILYRIFDSIHYWCHSLRWGHNYQLETLLPLIDTTKEDLLTNHRSDPSILADPSFGNLSMATSTFQQRLSSCPTRITEISTRLTALPLEIFYTILYNLDFNDVLCLLQALRYRPVLTPTFWESRFWLSGETGFADSLSSLSHSREDVFFAIRSAIRQGSNVINLQNRKRIWQLGAALNSIVYAISDFESHEKFAMVSTEQQWDSSVSCLALNKDSEGCRELRQTTISLTGEIVALTMSYITIYDQQLVCGLAFSFRDGRSVDLGYSSLLKSESRPIADKDGPQHLWFVCSPSGFKNISLEYPKEFLEGSMESGMLALTRRSLEGVTRFYIGLDYMRLVRFSASYPLQEVISNILWMLPYPSLTPSFHADDANVLLALQNESFTPASFILATNKILAIKIYSPLGRCAGVTGIGFLGIDQKESTWGAIDDAASMVFFLREAEQLVKVVVFQRDSVACHVQFTTNLGRTSEHFPELPNHKGLVFERVKFKASDEDFIMGFCGCFKANLKQFHCLGVLSRAEAISSKSAFVTTKNKPAKLYGMSLGGIRDHGQHHSCLDFHKNYRSVQASITVVETKYRRVGQVTGLLFHVIGSDTPQLLGQFSSFGTLHDLRVGEKIIDIHVTTTTPIMKNLPRLGPTQVQNLVVITNQRRISWGTVEDTEILTSAVEGITRRKEKVIWEFNAIYDRVTCI